MYVEYRTTGLGTFDPGSLIDENAFLSRAKRSLTVVATKDSDITDGVVPHHLPEGDGQDTISGGELYIQCGVRTELELH